MKLYMKIIIVASFILVSTVNAQTDLNSRNKKAEPSLIAPSINNTSGRPGDGANHKRDDGSPKSADNESALSAKKVPNKGAAQSRPVFTGSGPATSRDNPDG